MICFPFDRSCRATFLELGVVICLFKNASVVRREASILNMKVISGKVGSAVFFPEELRTAGPDCLPLLHILWCVCT